jgi:hypothetical protein
MKYFLICLFFIPFLIYGKENFEHKHQLMMETHIYEINQIAMDICDFIPSPTHDKLMYHIDELKLLIYD